MTEHSKLLPCPFCGGGTNLIHENKGVWNGMKYGEPVSIEVRHWCEKQEGQPSPRLLKFVGRDKESAIKAWNTRADNTQRYKEALEAMVRSTFGDSFPIASKEYIRALQSIAQNALKNNPEDKK